MTPERKAQIRAQLARARPKPKVIARSDVGAIRDADVHVSKADPNAHGTDKLIQVRRDDWVTINFAEYERQQAEKARYRQYLRDLDPFRLGLYGPIDDDE